MSSRAHVTLLFCDLVGSTVLLARLGEERYDEVRRDLFEVLERPVALHGGTIVKNLGDGLMLAFETRIEDALACAVAMQRQVTRLGRRDPQVPLAIRVGIACGEATNEDGDWFGTPVVEAARLCSQAGTSEVLVARAALTDATLPPRCSLEDRGRVTLKGFPDPVPTAALQWPVPEDDGRAALPAALDTEGAPPFAGRDNELDVLSARWAEVVDGATRVVVVSGAAGIGKTRTLAELAARARKGGAAVLYGAGEGAFVAAVRSYAASATVEDLRRVAGVDVGALASAVPLVALRLPEVAAAEKPATPKGTLLARVLTRIANDRPVLVVLDDMHRAPAAQIALLVDVLSAAPKRVLVACAMRLSADGDGGEGSRLLEKVESLPESTIVDLDPIDDDAATVLADAVLGQGARRWGPLITAEAGGSPARIIAAARALAVARVDDGAAEAEARAALRTTAPYKGLPSFQTEDEALFFGRGRAVTAVVDAVARSSFVAVIGASGSGKSSLVRAGVLARLRRGVLPHMADWERRIVTPTGLVGDALAEHTRPPRDGGGAVLFVDQLEELFTMIPDAAERARIADGIVEATGDRVRVIVALRADFFGHCAGLPHLADAIVADDLLLGAMDERELRETVTGPAAVAGVELEPGLADVVVADVAGEPGALPLLSHAMYETWNRRSGLRLTLADYREAGGVRGAIARTADDVFRHRLDGDEQAIARAVFLRATEPGEGTEDTRRRVNRSELTMGADAAALGRVLDVLVGARMLTVDGDSVEVAHEALIREWPLLREWLDEDREGLRLHRSLTHATQQWLDGGRETADLYRGARLARALEWGDAHPDLLNEHEVAFLDAARAGRDAEQDALAARVRAQSRANRRLRGLLAGVGVALVGALIAGVLALNQRSRADDQARLADARRLAVQVRDLAPTRPDLALLLAVEAFHLDAGTTTASSLQAALREKPHVTRYLQPGSTTRVAAFLGASGLLAVADETSLRLWDVASGTVAATLAGPAKALSVLPDGSRLTAVLDDGTVHVWDVASRTQVDTAPTTTFAPTAGQPEAVSPVGDLVARASDATVSFARRDGTPDPEHPTFEASVGPITDLAISADGRTLAVAGRSIALLALDGREQLKRSDLSLPGSQVLTGEASPDGHLLVVSSVTTAQSQVLATDGYAPVSPVVTGVARFRDDRTIVAANLTGAGAIELRVLDAATGAPAGASASIAGASATIYDVSAKGKRLVFATSDGNLLLVEESGGSLQTRTVAVPGSGGVAAKAVAFDDAGDLVVVTTATGVPLVMDVRSSTRIDAIDATLAPRSLTARFRPDGEVLAVAAEGGDIVRFNTKTWQRIGEPLRGLGPTTLAMAYTPDGNRLALLGDDDKARVIDLPTGQVLGEPLPAASHSGVVAFARDGRLLLASSPTGIGVWDLDPAAWVVDACRVAGRNLTQEEWDKYLPGRSYRPTCPEYG